MLERYFIKGARFRWSAPGAVSNQVADGSIVVNPPMAPPVMTYLGLDSEIISLGLPTVATMGLVANAVLPYSWLAYVPGRTAKMRSGGNDVLTGFMSGCLISTWTDAGGSWVGHIGTVESAAKDQPPNSTVKETFLMAMPATASGFNPAKAWTFGEIMPVMSASRQNVASKILALVTGAGQFYSVLMLSRVASEPGVWICGGKKQVTGLSTAELITELGVSRARR